MLNLRLGVVVYACNFSTWDVFAGELQVLGQPQLPSKFEANLDHIVETVSKTKNQKINFLFE
jgi:hypothetical protein